MTEGVDLGSDGGARRAAARIMAPTDHDHRTPFDHEAEAGADLTQEFWGTSRGWQPTRDQRDQQHVASASRRDDTTGAIRAIRDGMAAFRPQRVDLRDATGQVRRTRTHGAGPHVADPGHDGRPVEASIGDLAAGHTHDPFLDDPFPGDPFHDDPFDVVPHGSHDLQDPAVDDRDLVPLSTVDRARSGPRLGAVDPLLARFGALALVGVLLVPVALSLRPSDPSPDNVRIESPAPTAAGAGSADASSDDLGQPATASGEATATEAPVAAASSDVAAEAPADVAAAPQAQVAAGDQAAAAPVESSPAGTSSDAAGQDGSEPVSDRQATSETASDGAIADAATVDESAERVVPSCPQTYTAGAGDSWFRIADAAGVSPGAVMAENRATGDTVILPGDEICLPADATIPSPPPSPEPDTTAAPTTTAAPATTTAPTTTDAPAPPASVAEVKTLIRATWPEEEHETALRIADRESSFNPRADNNWCCYGVFQIYFTVHQNWLDDFGVYQASDLFDAEKNIAAAYHLYEQSGGWGPWGF